MQKQDFLDLVQTIQATVGDARASAEALADFEARLRANPIRPSQTRPFPQSPKGPSRAGGLVLVASNG